MAQGSPTIILISSALDPASTNISTELVEHHGFTTTKVLFKGKPLYQRDSLLLCAIEEDVVYPPPLDEYFNPQAYIFLSRHRAESGIPSLTVHTTGNFSHTADFGGKPREVGRVAPELQKNYLLALKKRENLLKGYQITIEATHHGPTSLQKPVLFVEIGSSEEQWRKKEIASIVAESLMESLTQPRSWDKVAVGFGGTHYSDKFNSFLVETDFALASVAAKYALEYIDQEMLMQMMQKSTKFVKYAALDWKGLGPHREKILRLIEQFALELVRL
jgi:D-aminoacyl-tRNA deacylase